MFAANKISRKKILTFFILFYFLNPMFAIGTDESPHAELDTNSLFQQAINEANCHNYESAIKLLETIIEKDNTNLEVHNTLIWVFIHKKQLREIEQRYQEKVSADQRDYVSLYNLGTIAFLKKDFTKAEDYYNRALKLAPNVPLILNNA